jgi:2-methylaconitate isomerase
MNKSTQQLVAEANALIETVPVAQAIQLLGSDDVVFIDIRELQELEAEGAVPGSIHASRGMLEWMADPASPRHNPVFNSGKKLLLYCAGAGRSALATRHLQELGFTNIAHIEGGIHAWIAANGPVVKPTSKDSQ